MFKPQLSKRVRALAGATTLAAAGAAATFGFAGGAGAAVNPTTFEMVRSAASVKANCLLGAHANVTITQHGPVEVMKVAASQLPKNTDFDLFVIQVPNAPFGLSWYQGDLNSDSTGHAHGTFVGRFSIETFAVAPGSAPSPVVFHGPFPDASSNPPFNPVHTYHLGLWFNSPTAAAAAGCAGAITPFNGEHNAGVQALSTAKYPDQAGPLRKVH
jgi:hypothetical protein